MNHQPPGIHTRTELPSMQMSDLIYELLDAHQDTAELADALSVDLRWRIHLQYLTDLQRVGRETLARLSAEQL